MWQDFKNFIFRGNVADLAVAVVIGAAFGAIINAFVKDFLTPIIAAIGGKPNFSNLSFSVNHSTFLYGDFINNVLSFLIIATVVYFLVVLPMNKVKARASSKKQIANPTKECPECLSEIPAAAKRCKYCTASLIAR